MNPKKLVTFLIAAAALVVLPLLLQQGGNAWVRTALKLVRSALSAPRTRRSSSVS